MQICSGSTIYLKRPLRNCTSLFRKEWKAEDQRTAFHKFNFPGYLIKNCVGSKTGKLDLPTYFDGSTRLPKPYLSRTYRRDTCLCFFRPPERKFLGLFGRPIPISAVRIENFSERHRRGAPASKDIGPSTTLAVDRRNFAYV